MLPKNIPSSLCQFSQISFLTSNPLLISQDGSNYSVFREASNSKVHGNSVAFLFLLQLPSTSCICQSGQITNLRVAIVGSSWECCCNWQCLDCWMRLQNTDYVNAYFIVHRLNLDIVQRSAITYANVAKQDPGRGKQNWSARAGTNFSQLRSSLLADLCSLQSEKWDSWRWEIGQQEFL